MPVPGASFAEIPQGQIRPNPVQPRTEFDEVALAELVASIKEVGLLQPIVVRQFPSPTVSTTTNSSWVSVGGVLPRKPGFPRSRPSSATPAMTGCSWTHFWRTSSVPS